MERSTSASGWICTTHRNDLSDNKLGFDRVPRGWIVEPEPTLIPPLAAYQAQRRARGEHDPQQADRARTAGDNQLHQRLTVDRRPRRSWFPRRFPRREGNLVINGSLEDSTDDNALCLTRDADARSADASATHAGRSEDDIAGLLGLVGVNCYIAFKVGGLSTRPLPSAQNCVRYDFRRAGARMSCS